MLRAKMLDVGDVYDHSKDFKLQAKFTCIYMALYSVSVDAPPPPHKNKKKHKLWLRGNKQELITFRSRCDAEVSAHVCLF